MTADQPEPPTCRNVHGDVVWYVDSVCRMGARIVVERLHDGTYRTNVERANMLDLAQLVRLAHLGTSAAEWIRQQLMNTPPAPQLGGGTSLNASGGQSTP